MSTPLLKGETLLRGKLNLPITRTKAKQLGLHPITDPYKRTREEERMVLSLLADLRRSNILARVVPAGRDKNGPVEVWRA